MKTLLPHQIEDAQFMASKEFVGNFSGMGSGKTLTALEAFRLSRELVTDQVIIVGPPISLHMWQQEFEAFFPGDRAQWLKTGKTKIDGSATAIICSWAIARTRVAELRQLGARCLILDEAHACKNIKSKTTKAILGRNGLCSSVSKTFFLTGTPETRWHDDLFSFLCRADLPGMRTRCGGAEMDRFRLRFCITQRKQWPGARFPVQVTVGNRNTDELNEWIFGEGLAVRRELAEVWAAMPPLTVNHLQVQLDSDAELRAMLKDLDKKTMRQIEQEIADQSEHLATIRRRLGLAKIKHSVAEIVDRVEAGTRPILVGAWHTDVIDGLVEALTAKGIKCGIIDGRTKDKAAQQDAFNNGDIDVLVAQTAAAGVSLNLQGGSHIIEVEQDWSPSIQDQFRARCHRMGQQSHVHVDVFASDTKLDKALASIAANKRREHARVMRQGDAA